METTQLTSERVLQLLRELDFRSRSEADCEQRDELLIQLSRQDVPDQVWDPQVN